MKSTEGWSWVHCEQGHQQLRCSCIIYGSDCCMQAHVVMHPGQYVRVYYSCYAALHASLTGGCSIVGSIAWPTKLNINACGHRQDCFLILYHIYMYMRDHLLSPCTDLFNDTSRPWYVPERPSYLGKCTNSPSKLVNLQGRPISIVCKLRKEIYRECMKKIRDNTWMQVCAKYMKQMMTWQVCHNCLYRAATCISYWQ